MHVFDKSFKNTDTIVSISKSVFNKNLMKKIDLFLKSKDKTSKDLYAKDIQTMYNSPLFDKNMSGFLNNNWKNNSNYFLDYNDTILNPVIKHIFETGDASLIQPLIESGLSYINEFILCVNPSLYSHSAIILKFNKPIKFDDSNSNVAGILYSFSIKAKTNNRKIKLLDKLMDRFMQLVSLFWGKKGYMTRVLLTSDDFSKLEKNKGDDVFNLSKIDGTIVKNSINLSFAAIKTLDKVSSKLSELDTSMRNLTSDIEKISYFFSLYTKDNINYVSIDKIISYSFKKDVTYYSVTDFAQKSDSTFSFLPITTIHKLRRI